MQFMATTPSEYILTALGTLGFYGVIRFFIRRKSDGKDVNWTPLEAVGITIAIYFTTQLIAAVAAGYIGSTQGLNSDQINTVLEDSAGWQFLMILFMEALTAWLVYVFVTKIRRTSFKAIGVVRPKTRDIGYALLGFGTYFLVYGMVIFNIIERYFPQINTGQKQDLGFSSSVAGPELIFVFLSLVILPPLVEELLVRGFLYTGLRTKLPIMYAAILASLVFASAHLQWGSGNPLLWTAAVDTFILSMVLIWLRQKTGSLWPGIGVHFLKNSIAFIVLFVLKVS
jgi:membrane protease YdiL (CAAX protease family)